MKCIQLLVFLAICQSLVLTSCGQPKPPFYDEIQEFKKSDKEAFPPRNAILFVGSSSIRLWNDIHAYFPGYPVLQRGFGGSGLNDAIRYAGDIIVPYQPRQVVIYSGENDVAEGNVTSTDVLQRFTALFQKIRKGLPDAHIAYISMKPSPSRVVFMPVMNEANSMIRDFLGGHKRTAFIDVYHPMLRADGKPRGELFLDDSLHMNVKGYALWREELLPVLVK